MTTGLVCLIGIGTVFVGLICIVLICKVMGLVIGGFAKDSEKATTTAAAVAQPEMSADEKRAVLAGVCAVIAEELGTDVSNIRVRSFRRI